MKLWRKLYMKLYFRVRIGTPSETEIQDESEDMVYSEHVEKPYTTSKKKRKLK
jgi:hypothetical protein